MIRLTLKCDGARCKAAVAVKLDTIVPGWKASNAEARTQLDEQSPVELSMVAPVGWQLLQDRQILCPTCRLRRILARPMLEEPAVTEGE